MVTIKVEIKIEESEKLSDLGAIDAELIGCLLERALESCGYYHLGKISVKELKGDDAQT